MENKKYINELSIYNNFEKLISCFKNEISVKCDENNKIDKTYKYDILKLLKI